MNAAKKSLVKENALAIVIGTDLFHENCSLSIVIVLYYDC